LRDRQLNDNDLSWAGVWAVDPEVTKTFRVINEESYTIAEMTIPYIDNPYTVLELVGVQMHKEHIYYQDALINPISDHGCCSNGPPGPGSTGYSGVDYNVNYREFIP
uniref:hypothetical protein n=1 Tax=Psychromonas sp. Urea-02u-13 TaxID=2058326 RepID=UPI000CBFDE32